MMGLAGSKGPGSTAFEMTCKNSSVENDFSQSYCGAATQFHTREPFLSKEKGKDFIAFHNSLTTRQFYVERVLAHQFAQEIIQGTSWKTTAAGAVGSTLHSNQHSQYEELLGIPRQLAYLEDRLFEGLPTKEAQAFPFAFLTSIPLGADLSLVLARFLLWLLIDPEHGVVRFAGKHGQVMSEVATLYQRLLNGEAVAKPEWPPLIHAASTRGRAALEATETFQKKSALFTAAAAEKASHAFDATVMAA